MVGITTASISIAASGQMRVVSYNVGDVDEHADTLQAVFDQFQQPDEYGASSAIVENIAVVGAPVFDGAESKAYVVIICEGDTDGDGVVGVSDLINVLLDWGSNGSANGGDVDHSAVVDVFDLIAVITGWGPCLCDDCAAEPLSLCQEFINAGLTQDDCDEFQDNLDDANYRCWTLHYLNGECCGTCPTCPPTCPGADPYGRH